MQPAAPFCLLPQSGNLFQQPGKHFAEFLTCVNAAWEQRTDPVPDREMLIKQLIWEGLIAPTCNAVPVVHNEGIHQVSIGHRRS